MSSLGLGSPERIDRWAGGGNTAHGGAIGQRCRGFDAVLPTYVRARQDQLAHLTGEYSVEFVPGMPLRAGLRGIEYDVDQVQTSGWGFHAGGTVTVFLTRALGVGARVQYVRANVDIRNSLGTQRELIVERVRAGGLQVLGGPHFQF